MENHTVPTENALQEQFQSLKKQFDAIQKLQEEGQSYYRFYYVISLLVISFKRSTKSKLMSDKDWFGRFITGLPYSIVSAVLGWWGFPWGLIYTPIAIIQNISGGENVSDIMLKELHKKMTAIQKQMQPGN